MTFKNLVKTENIIMNINKFKFMMEDVSYNIYLDKDIRLRMMKL
jgi:hypothetical protein